MVQTEVSNHTIHLLIAQDLTKSYGPRPALRGLSFFLRAGRILGFLGPNGAGKTTAIRILTTMLEPDAGRFIVAGINSRYPHEIRSKIGVLPESLGFPKNITGLEYLSFYARLYGRSAPQAKAQAVELLHEVGLEARARSLIGTYSHGMRQRLGIARALVNDPLVVFLDEPTLGLDPRGQRDLLSLVRRIARDRRAGVILCSHDLPEVEMVCDDVLILNKGEVIASGITSDVIGKIKSRDGEIRQGHLIRIQVPTTSFDAARKALTKLPAVKSVTPQNEHSGYLRVKLRDGGEQEGNQIVYNRVLEMLIRADIPILRFEVEGSRLQDVFLQLTEEKI